MRRPYTTYLLAIVAPSALAVVATVHATSRSWDHVRATSDERVARTVLAVFQQDIGRAVDSLLAAALPSTTLDTSDPLVARALAGDTVSGMRPSVPGQELFVLAPAAEGDPVGSARLATGPLPRRSAIQVGRAAGYSTALYLGGRRWTGTEPAAGPDDLTRPMLRRVAQSPKGIRMVDGKRSGSVAQLDIGGSGAVVALAIPRDPGPAVIPIPLLLVTGLLMLFAALAGWIQMAGQPGRSVSATMTSLFLLSLVPALTAGALLVQTSRLFREGAQDANARDLARGLAVASVRRATGAPDQVRLLTGFDASLIREGALAATTFAEPAPKLASLPAPPASFTAAGHVETPGGPADYVALRVDGSAFLVATAPDPVGAVADFTSRAWTIAVALGAWLLLVALAVAAQFMRSASSSSTGTTSGAVS